MYTTLGLDSQTHLNLRYRKNGDLSHASLNFVPNVGHREFISSLLSNSNLRFGLFIIGYYFLKVC